MRRYQDKHVVITGASSGIGRALARAFGAEGATVWLGARREKELAEAAREVDSAGGVGRALPLDVTKDQSVTRFARAVGDEAPGVDVLVNNAGVGGSGSVDDVSIERWRRAIDTNLTGPFLVTKAFLPALRRREGRRHVLNIVSVAGKQGLPNGGAYAASKFGLRGWTEAIAQELAPEGIRVVGILPGYVATPLVRGAAEASRMIDADEMARTIVDLTLLPESLFLDEVTIWPWKMYAD